jgi:hypothetical protein
MINRIAFCGYSRTGKDTAALPLLVAGYERRAFGDIIKRQIDTLVTHHMGFSAFTTISEEKAKIRRTLESWGEDNYDAILEEFFNELPERCVNTRLCRVREARRWIEEGGVLVEIARKPNLPHTEWEQRTMVEMRSLGLVSKVIHNDSTEAELHRHVSALVLV